MLASWCNELEVVNLLILNDACVNNRNKYGSTALIWALQNGHSHSKIVTLLNKANKIEEWRPWNHSILPHPYRQSMSTLLLLAKIS